MTSYCLLLVEHSMNDLENGTTPLQDDHAHDTALAVNGDVVKVPPHQIVRPHARDVSRLSPDDVNAGADSDMHLHVYGDPPELNRYCTCVLGRS